MRPTENIWSGLRKGELDSGKSINDIEILFIYIWRHQMKTLSSQLLKLIDIQFLQKGNLSRWIKPPALGLGIATDFPNRLDSNSQGPESIIYRFDLIQLNSLVRDISKAVTWMYFLSNMTNSLIFSQAYIISYLYLILYRSLVSTARNNQSHIWTMYTYILWI